MRSSPKNQPSATSITRSTKKSIKLKFLSRVLPPLSNLKSHLCSSAAQRKIFQVKPSKRVAHFKTSVQVRTDRNKIKRTNRTDFWLKEGPKQLKMKASKLSKLTLMKETTSRAQKIGSSFHETTTSDLTSILGANNSKIFRMTLSRLFKLCITESIGS